MADGPGDGRALPVLRVPELLADDTLQQLVRPPRHHLLDVLDQRCGLLLAGLRQCKL